MKQNVLKNSLNKNKPLVPEVDLPEKIPLTSVKNFDEAENKLEQIYPKAKSQPPVVPIQDTVKLTVQNEANPFIPINKIREQKALVLFDEIDAFIHPYIQTHLLYDLIHAFPNIQFIVSSHSPLSIAGLNKEHIILLEEDRPNQTVMVVPSPINTWVLGVDAILRKLQNTVLKYSKEYDYDSLLQKLSEVDDLVTINDIESKLKEIEDSIEYERD